MSYSGAKTKGTQTMKGKRFTTEEKIRILRDADQLNLDMGSVRCLSGHLKDDPPLA